MVVRVRVRLRSTGGEVVTAALANSGFETEEPEVILPTRVAERPGIYPRLPSGSQVEEYTGVGGVVVRTFVVKRSVNVSLLTSDREIGPSDAVSVVTPGEDEVILSDKLMDALKIVLLRPGEGVWKLVDDGENVVRKSEHSERW